MTATATVSRATAIVENRHGRFTFHAVRPLGCTTPLPRFILPDAKAQDRAGGGFTEQHHGKGE